MIRQPEAKIDPINDTDWIEAACQRHRDGHTREDIGGSRIRISLSQTTEVISSVLAIPDGAIVVIKDRVERTTEMENAAPVQTTSQIGARGNQSVRKYINRDPAVMPSIAMLLAKKAR
jgi:hypothetical protein